MTWLLAKNFLFILQVLHISYDPGTESALELHLKVRLQFLFSKKYQQCTPQGITYFLKARLSSNMVATPSQIKKKKNGTGA